MTPSSHAIVEIKNQWLWSQVDVEYPTPESIKGRALYQTLSEQRQTQPLLDQPVQGKLDDIYLVDFHRLTIMFALLQASQMASEEEQNLLVEFFTQIIYSEPCALYLGFSESEPVAAAILTAQADAVLLSDVVVRSVSAFGDEREFANAVVAKWLQNHAFSGDVFIEL
ncbi:hypothetical protein KW419_21755 [Vibrio fluvialis]|uniref:Flavodoxin n=2 Tax=Vibrio TaxID=662 RepID=S7I648_VIBFL|nr:hypothetical protein [Vibrio fluvialis]TNF17072.1 MAG: hypothetical protein EP325_06700 [Vibrionaceae bacterium]EKO3376671.1 hypothetical protein [Vibrio fluvialis]EKO3386683.1 hypothetical protein [Vibrio fluvialis]EKO3388003.1 hypothetical protein [Vibrio fluvialis]EKO3915433.1 hypothetical protein [Vibrio fluvialis]